MAISQGEGGRESQCAPPCINPCLWRVFRYPLCVQVSAAGHQREIETLRRSAKELKRQVHDLQELLANREREHIKEMERSKPLTDQQVNPIIPPPPPIQHEKSTLRRQISLVYFMILLYMLMFRLMKGFVERWRESVPRWS